MTIDKLKDIAMTRDELISIQTDKQHLCKCKCGTYFLIEENQTYECQICKDKPKYLYKENQLHYAK